MKKACLTHSEIETKLREAGVQATSQRISICQYVLCEADHPTADEIFQWAEKNMPKVSLATVYNTLNVLVEAGILCEFRFPHTDKVIYDDNLNDHHHFLDEKTQRLYDIPAGDVQIKLELKNKNFKVNKMDVLFKGQFRKTGGKNG